MNPAAFKTALWYRLVQIDELRYNTDKGYERALSEYENIKEESLCWISLIMTWQMR